MIKLSTIKAGCEKTEIYNCAVSDLKPYNKLAKEMKEQLCGISLTNIYQSGIELQLQKGTERTLLEHTLLVLTTIGFEVDYKA